MLAKKLSPLLSQSFVRPATLQHVRHINTVDRLDSLFSNGYSAAKGMCLLSAIELPNWE